MNTVYSNLTQGHMATVLSNLTQGHMATVLSNLTQGHMTTVLFNQTQGHMATVLSNLTQGHMATVDFSDGGLRRNIYSPRQGLASPLAGGVRIAGLQIIIVIVIFIIRQEVSIPHSLESRGCHKQTKNPTSFHYGFFKISLESLTEYKSYVDSLCQQLPGSVQVILLPNLVTRSSSFSLLVPTCVV